MENKESLYYRQIYLELAPMMIRFAQKFVSAFFAEDIVHDVFLKLWDRQIFLLPLKEVKRILYVAVKNACIDHLRKMHLEQEITDKLALQLKLEELDFFEASDELFMREDMLNQLLKKVDELPEKAQIIFRLSYLEGMKAAEIAEQLNISVRTVENHLYRSLVFLRKQNFHLLLTLFSLL